MNIINGKISRLTDQQYLFAKFQQLETDYAGYIADELDRLTYEEMEGVLNLGDMYETMTTAANLLRKYTKKMGINEIKEVLKNEQMDSNL